MNIFIWVVIAYFIGSIPTAYIVGRCKKVDIREWGSGNVGATNTYRILGKWLGLLVLVIDIAKGFLPVFIANRYGQGEENSIYGLFLVGAFAVIGHMYPLWLKFRGGKGVATAGGIMLAISPALMFTGMIIFFLTLFYTHTVSLSSIISIGSLPFAFFLYHNFDREMPFFFFLLTLAVTVVVKHRANIRRIRNGTESKLGSFAR